MVRVVSKAASQTLVEGRRDCRPSRGWVSMCFEFNNSTIPLYLEKTYTTIPP